MAVLTSIANDYDYSEIFARQVKTLGEEGDISIAISTAEVRKISLKLLMLQKRKG